MNVLFVNSQATACGVHQFGLSLHRILQGGRRHHFQYCSPGSTAELLDLIRSARADILLYNFYPCTMPWITLQTLNAVRALGLKQITIFHEVPVTGFDAFIYPDPTFEGKSERLNDWFSMGRPLPPAAAECGMRNAECGKKKKKKIPEIPVIGSAGFGFGWKGHERLVRKVIDEFATAKIRLHLPFAAHGDADGAGALSIAANCRELVRIGALESFVPQNIELEISHDFMPSEEFVAWLAENDLNAYLYDNTPESRGIASTTDHALAARRPIAITRSWMFRHLLDVSPSICIEDHSLREVMAAGATPLKPVYEANANAKILDQVESVIDRIWEFTMPAGGYNRLLTDNDRDGFEPIVAEMSEQLPEMMSRKIAAANVQQAWMLQMVRYAEARRILCVGCHEDTAYHIIKDEKHTAGIDPACNWDLATFLPMVQPEEKFDCIFATSVIEHVENDEQFIRDICALLIPDGVAILTCDFLASWKPGDPKPTEDVRFYTPADYERLGAVLESCGCYWLDRPKLEGEPDFEYHGHRYSFATMIFKKL